MTGSAGGERLRSGRVEERSGDPDQAARCIGDEQDLGTQPGGGVLPGGECRSVLVGAVVGIRTVLVAGAVLRMVGERTVLVSMLPAEAGVRRSQGARLVVHLAVPEHPFHGFRTGAEERQ